MSLRPLELAQNLLNQAQQAQQKLGEAAADRAQASVDAEHEQSEALKQLHQVAKEREVQGHRVGDEEAPGREHAEGQSGSGPQDGTGNGAPPEPPHHADETPEGKGRTLDIDV